MFEDRYHSLMSSNRRLEKSLKHLQHVLIQNPQDLQVVNDYILQVCDQNGLKKETKYLVKKSLDMYVLKFVQACSKEILFAAFNFLFMAVKFNEDPQIQEEITLKWYLENSQFNSNPYKIEDFISFQIQIFNLPDFNFNFTTPYDYLGLYTSTFMIDRKMVKRILNVLDFSLTIPELMFASAQELFFGTMLMIGEEKNYEREWILRQTFSREESQKVGQTIKQCYRREIESIKREGAQS